MVCHRERNARSRRHLAREAELDRLKALRAQRSLAGKASWASRRRTGVGVPFLTVGVD